MKRETVEGLLLVAAVLLLGAVLVYLMRGLH